MTYKIGDKVITKRRFSQQDVENFAELTGDTNPIHLDHEYAEKSIFGRRVVHGIFTMSLFSKLFGTQYPGNGGIYLAHSCKFIKPVYVGDEVQAEIELVELDQDKLIGTFNTMCYNEAGELVLSGQAKVKLPR